jgi:hypothetical protein
MQLWPEGQGRHRSDPLTFVYHPAAHVKQPEALPVAYVPDRQGVGWWPDAQRMPPGQGWQIPDPASE